MNQDEYSRLLALIAATATDESDELFCDDVQKLLASYVELELAGERDAATFAAVDRHLALCPDCREEYEALRDVLAAYPSLELPSGTLDVARLPAEPQGAPTPAGWRRLWDQLRASPALQTGGVFRGQPRAREIKVEIASLGPGVSLRLQPALEAQLAALHGQIAPAPADPGELAVRLYALSTVTPVDLAFTREARLDDLGAFDFERLSPGDYMLTLVRAHDEAPLFLLKTADWK